MNSRYKDGTEAKAGDIVTAYDENGLPYTASVIGEKEVENLPGAFDLQLIPLAAGVKLVRSNVCSIFPG